MSIPNYIEWTDDLSVGIQEIDEQHKYLVQLVNELNAQLLTQGNQRDIIEEALDRLMRYTETHFVVEESLMRILGYPDYEPHKQHHEDLLRMAHDFREQLRHDGKISRIELMEFLHKWLTHHILKEDTQYSEHFLSRGAQRSWLKGAWLKKFWK
ncbi:bacteriohemerythrin [Plasticicumulans acidivorans]|uniref:Hemerythrin n=1 Tax=Plasticicumulans acidivorans TaxID=886464 RepID=A0A317MUX2_9GAMM|nr:bacteriohemerythrin [Plasticicumulans acidivorans]PWV60640.1 hemerythrin [Plasticicumulans acidivorans]